MKPSPWHPAPPPILPLIRRYLMGTTALTPILPLQAPTVKP